MNTSSTGAPDGERFISLRIAASPLRFLLLAVALGSGAHTTLSAESSRFGVRAVPGTCGWYRVLPTVHREAAPIQSVRLGVSQDAETTVYTLDLWWIRDLDRTGQNAASQRYRRLLRAAFDQVHAAFDNGKSFDIAVDDGRTPQGYRTVIRLTDSN